MCVHDKVETDSAQKVVCTGFARVKCQKENIYKMLQKHPLEHLASFYPALFILRLLINPVCRF